MTARPWEVVHHRESVAAFHGRPIPDPVTRSVWVCDPTSPAVVLGSAQRDSVIDQGAAARAGVEVVRRHSGGGAVLVVPGELLWLDLMVPVSDPLWRADVGTAFEWVGELWAAALADVGVASTVHCGRLQRSPWSDLVCFAGLGPGEVLVDGRKAVGISQRRTRAGARFQCAALARWEPTALVELLALDPAARPGAVDDLAHAAGGVGVALDDLLVSVLRHLP